MEQELNERKHRADGLKVFRTADPNVYLVESSDQTKLYRVWMTDGKATCPCPDYTRHAKKGESWKCKHVLALEEAMAKEAMALFEEAPKKEEVMQQQQETMRREPPKLNRQLLEQPFTPELIKQRKGKGGRTFDYIEGHVIIKRLNDAFEGLWSFEVTDYQIEKELGEIYVLGKLEAAGQRKMAFGSSELTKDKESGEVLSLGDDLKAAATDALKKAATLFGVGLHLYEDRKPQGAAKAEPTPSQTTTRPSVKKLTDLYTLAKEKGVSYKELEARSIFLFEKRPSKLTSEEIKKLMEDLNAG